MGIGGETGVGGYEGVGVATGFFEDVAIAEEIGDAERRETVLAGAEDIAWAADLEIDFGQLEAVGGADEGFETLARVVGLRIAEDAAEAGILAAADAAAKLVELGEAETMAAFDGHERGVGDVDAHFDDRGRDEHLDVTGTETVHHGVFFGGRHAAVNEAEPERFQLAIG